MTPSELLKAARHCPNCGKLAPALDAHLIEEAPGVRHWTCNADDRPVEEVETCEACGGITTHEADCRAIASDKVSSEKASDGCVAGFLVIIVGWAVAALFWFAPTLVAIAVVVPIIIGALVSLAVNARKK